ncbi:hypothetical protein GQ53DRAFT_86041 [Thozetella sp. PMI_491]|nr:hypothetical protein GQ53DRAFT_86041 [Thozetella sp. PMI_491]
MPHRRRSHLRLYLFFSSHGPSPFFECLGAGLNHSLRALDPTGRQCEEADGKQAKLLLIDNSLVEYTLVPCLHPAAWNKSAWQSPAASHVCACSGVALYSWRACPVGQPSVLGKTQKRDCLRSMHTCAWLRGPLSPCSPVSLLSLFLVSLSPTLLSSSAFG